MADELFRKAGAVTTEEVALIEHVWADVLRRNRWRRCAWRLINRVRACLRFVR
jgi:hypothetical protein